MRILHTIYDDPANPWLGGGGAIRTREISKTLSSRHDITILCGNYPGAPAEEDVDGCHIVRVGSDQSYPISRLSFSRDARRYVANASRDLWIYSFSAFAPIPASRQSRSRSILECFHVMQDHASEKRGLIGRAAAVIETRTLRRYDQVISISPSVQDKISAIRGHQNGMHLVYTGVDDICFLDDPVEEDYILYFGRLDTYTKGLDLLFEAFSRIGDTADGLRLVVGGRGTPERLSELRQLAEQAGITGRVTFTGPVSTEERTALYRASLFNVAPSRYEGWCIAAVEASAAGKAVVGTRIPGLQDAVRHDETGLLVESGNVDEIAGAMRTLIENPELRRSLGRQGRKWSEQFTWDRIALAQEQVYQDVLAGIA
jgi:glycosyltransferase involved in cell wall biosynthesis